MLYGLAAFLFLADTSIAGADGPALHGHLKYQLTQGDYKGNDLYAVHGDDSPTDQEADFRLKAEKHSGRWDLTAHYELLGVEGDSVETRRVLGSAGLTSEASATGLPSDDRRLFDLTALIADSERRAAVHRLDRLSVGYSGDSLVVRAGRQAVGLGNGLVFNPLDMFNPFSPTAVDKDYKTGDDMLYGQWLFESGDDIQAAVVPRRDPQSDDVESEQSSIAFKYHGKRGAMDYDLLAAGHYEEALLGAGMAADLRGAVWRVDAGLTDLDGEGHAASVVTNVDYSWTWLGHNIYGYLEYFRNGVGESNKSYAAPGRALAERISRGEVFSLGRDLVASGMRIELSPLVNVSPSVICNLNDMSIFAQVRADYDWKEYFALTFGINLPVGRRGTEYGGIPVGNTDYFLAPASEAYLRAAYFF